MSVNSSVLIAPRSLDIFMDDVSISLSSLGLLLVNSSVLIASRSLGIFMDEVCVSLGSLGLLVGLDIVACMLMVMTRHIDTINVVGFILILKKELYFEFAL